MGLGAVELVPVGHLHLGWWLVVRQLRLVVGQQSPQLQ